MKYTTLVLTMQLLIQTTALALPTDYVGELTQASPGVFELVNNGQTVQVQFTSQTEKAIPSLIGKIPFVEIKGAELLKDGSLLTSQVPTITSGNVALEGLLKANGSGYEIDGVQVRFGETKKINGAQFDQKSIHYFVEKNVRALGSMKDGIFTIKSIIRDDVFSAEQSPLVDGVSAEFLNSFNKNPIQLIDGLFKEKVASPSPNWFRGTVFSNKVSARPGDAVMIITAAGGEDDSLGATNGHFAVGLGHVGFDLKITAEIFNVYVTNEKEIVPGNIDLNDYLGSLISGQLNYRPTYTLVLYGIPEGKILQVKAELDQFHPLFRSGNTKITADKNCATMSVQALADIGIYGTQRNDPSTQNKFKVLSEQNGLPPRLSTIGQIAFVANTDRAEFMPGPAFEAILHNIAHLNQAENAGITRVDFIFGGQTPSGRPNGGPPTMGVLNQFEDQGKIGIGMGIKKITKIIK